MCHCCCGGYQYSPYQNYGMTYGYPYAGYGYPYYGLPLGYAYANPAPTVPAVYSQVITPAAAVAAPSMAVAPQYSRGEYRVGNCLMICQ